MSAAGEMPASPAELEAARLLLSRMGIRPEDLVAAATSSAVSAPTFAEYVPVVSAGRTREAHPCAVTPRVHYALALDSQHGNLSTPVVEARRRGRRPGA